MRTATFLAALGLAVLLPGCAQERSAGNSIETENSLAARDIPYDSIFDAPPPSSWKAMIFTLRLNRWNFPFAQSTADGRDLRVRTADGKPLSFQIVFWDSAAALARVKVRLDSADLANHSTVRLAWGDRTSSPLTDSASTWSGFSPSQILLLTSAPVDDFEDGDDTSSLPGRNVWRNGLSTDANLTVTIGDAGHGRAGKALKAVFSAPSPSYVVVAVPLGGPHVARSLDSVVFWTRGKGTLSLALEHLSGYVGPKAWVHLSLDTAWTRVRIRPSDFLPAEGSGWNQGWNRVRDSLTDLTFIGSDGSEFQIDDIRFHGLNPGDLK